MDSLFGEQYLLIHVSKKIDNFLDNTHSSEIESWAQESRDLAMHQSVGYRQNALKVVTNEYMESHFAIIQERIALGAIRLSQTLNSTYLVSN
jgi:hypothetical protein